jgi:dTDP-4-dehydrorhamnose reductase
MKLFITGAKGQLGQDLKKECQYREIDFYASDVDELDIADLESVTQRVIAEKPSAIVNCAAYNAVDKAEDDFENAKKVNGQGPQNLAIAANEVGIPIVHFGSDYVFDGKKGSPYTTEDEPNPISRYGESKLIGERLVMETTPKAFVVRLSWVFGTGNINFCKKVLKWARNEKTIRVVDDQVSSPSYTVDVAPTILALLNTNAYGLYHLANREYCSRYEWAKEIIRYSGKDVEVVAVKSDQFPTAAKRPEFSAMDLSKIEGVLGRKMPNWQAATKRFLLEMGIRV